MESSGERTSVDQCEAKCATKDGCKFFSHSQKWDNCILCSACTFSNDRTSRHYTSWSKQAANAPAKFIAEVSALRTNHFAPAVSFLLLSNTSREFEGWEIESEEDLGEVDAPPAPPPKAPATKKPKASPEPPPKNQAKADAQAGGGGGGAGLALDPERSSTFRSKVASGCTSGCCSGAFAADRSEEHTSELQSP